MSLKIGRKMYTHNYVISENKPLSSQIILGIDFRIRFNIRLYTKSLKLYIEGERIIIAELARKHTLMIDGGKATMCDICGIRFK